jgi:hypothetical protein
MKRLTLYDFLFKPSREHRRRRYYGFGWYQSILSLRTWDVSCRNLRYHLWFQYVEMSFLSIGFRGLRMLTRFFSFQLSADSSSFHKSLIMSTVTPRFSSLSSAVVFVSEYENSICLATLFYFS